MVLSGTGTVIADDVRLLQSETEFVGHLLWDLGTSIVIRDWMGERVYMKQLNPCVTALDPNTLFAHTITKRDKAFDISFTIFWHNKVEHCLRRWIRRFRKRKARQAVRKIEITANEISANAPLVENTFTIPRIL